MPNCICIVCNKPFIANRSTAKYCGCSRQTELKYIYNIPKIKKVKIRKISVREKTRAIVKLLGIKRIKCVECSKGTTLAIHHIDKDKTNNTLDNLQVLCKACHRLKHPELSDYLF